jgi:hypothetical protein
LLLPLWSLLVCTIGLRGNGKIGKINRKAASGAGHFLCPDMGGVHGNPRSEIKTPGGSLFALNLVGLAAV